MVHKSLLPFLLVSSIHKGNGPLLHNITSFCNVFIFKWKFFSFQKISFSSSFISEFLKASRKAKGALKFLNSDITEEWMITLPWSFWPACCYSRPGTIALLGYLGTHWLMFSCCRPVPPGPFVLGIFPTTLPPACGAVQGCCYPRRWNFTFLTLLPLAVAHWCSLFRSLCRAFLPSISAPTGLGVIHWLRVHFIPLST